MLDTAAQPVNHNAAIIIRFTLPGVHFWKDAPPPVAFLRTPHRHVFHFEVTKRVNHDDRDIEFIMFKEKVRGFIASRFPYVKEAGVHDFGENSCEMLGRLILDHFGCEIVEVYEDGENGAAVWSV